MSRSAGGDAPGEYRFAPYPRVSRVVAALCVLVAVSIGPLASGGSVATAGGIAPNAADHLLVWTGCDSLVQLTDAQLDKWRDRGVDAFSCGVQRLAGMGATHQFTGNLDALRGDQYAGERTLRDSHIVERAKKRGMKVYLGFYFTNAFNDATPLVEWFDDAGWSRTVIPAVRGIAAAAHALGFAGLSFDQELYFADRQAGTTTWDWSYPGNTHTEAETRTEVRKRGEQMMRAILGGFPDVDILAYHTKFPETFDELVQEQVNRNYRAYADSVQIDLWDGLTSVDGYHSIRFLNATFYKIPHLGTWETAYTYEYNRLFAVLSRRLSNWDYAAGRIFESPFVWINAGTRPFEAARSPEHVREQLLVAPSLGDGAYARATTRTARLEGFDYGPYESAMRAASRPGVVDRDPPVVSVAEAGGVYREGSGGPHGHRDGRHGGAVDPVEDRRRRCRVPRR